MPLKMRYLAIPAFAAAVLCGSIAAAQAPTPASPAPDPRAERIERWQATRHAGRGARGAHLAATMRNDPAVAVVINLRAIERAYRADGRGNDVPAFYRAQLARTQDPVVRNFVNFRLAKLEMREDDAKGALEALMRNLDENYARMR